MKGRELFRRAHVAGELDRPHVSIGHLHHDAERLRRNRVEVVPRQDDATAVKSGELAIGNVMFDIDVTRRRVVRSAQQSNACRLISVKGSALTHRTAANQGSAAELVDEREGVVVDRGYGVEPDLVHPSLDACLMERGVTSLDAAVELSGAPLFASDTKHTQVRFRPELPMLFQSDRGMLRGTSLPGRLQGLL